MKTKYYIIRTAYGDKYKTDLEGYVLEYSNGLKKDDNSEDRKSWKIDGIRQLLPFNNLGRLISLPESVNIENFRFKNKNPKFTIQDKDHGTTRIVGNTKYHGVVSISLI